jgi:hypothetical protein
VELLI